MNAAYAEIRGGAASEASEPDDSEPADESQPEGRGAQVAENLVRIGFLSGDARQASNPAVEVLATLLLPGGEVGVCLTCLGVKSNGEYECGKRSGSFRAMTVTDTVGHSLHPIARTEIVFCTKDELSWTVSQYVGQRTDNVTLYSIPFDDILGASVRGHKRDVVEVWIADGSTVSVHTRPREGDALCQYVERAATSG